MRQPGLLAGLAGVVVLSAVGLAVYFSSTATPDRDTLATTGLIALVRGGNLEVRDSEDNDAGAVDEVPVDGHIAWSPDAVSIGYGRGDTLYWSPTNLQFSRRISTIAPGSRFYWSPTGKEVLVQTARGVSIVDKADKQIWHLDDSRKPLGWWTVTGLVGSAVIVADGPKVQILSTYNNEALWTFDAVAAYASPTSPALLLQRTDGWAIWEPRGGMRPITGLAASGSAAWDPNGQRVVIEATGPGGNVLVDIADLKATPLGVSGKIAGWTAEQIAITRGDSIDLVRPGATGTRSFGGASFAGIQPVAPKAVSTAKPGRVAFTSIGTLPDGGVSVAVTTHPDGQINYIVDYLGRVVADINGRQTTVLDITDRVTAVGEAGLLDLVLHPAFARNRTAYVYYGTGGRTPDGDRGPRRNVIASFEVTPDGLSAVPGSFRERYSRSVQRQEPLAHNGGTLAFAPNGALYLAEGDFGDSAAKITPVDHPSGSFFEFNVEQAGAWAPVEIGTGLRNPFRFAVDPITTQVWIADVGAAQRDELNILTRGGDYGWPGREGDVCQDGGTACPPRGLTPLLAWYPYTGGHPCGGGVIGGFVYRGAAMPNLRGWYIYTDLCSGDILAIDPGATLLEPLTLGRFPRAPEFGGIVDLVPDTKGEPLAVGLTGGVWRVIPATN